MKYVYAYVGIGIAIAAVGSLLIFQLESKQSNQTGPIIFETDKTEYKIGEPITITMKNVGTVTYRTSSLTGFMIVDENGRIVCSWFSMEEMLGVFPANYTKTHVWDQKDCNTGKQVLSGIYIVKADLFNINPIPTYVIKIS